MDDQDEPREVSDLERPVDPPSGVRRLAGGERQLTRRVIAPAALLLVSVPVVALLFLNLRSVSGDSEPASARTSRSTSATPSPSASASASTTPTPTPTPPTPTPTPTTPAVPSGPSVSAVSATTGPAAGGTVLTVTGADLGAVTQVLFGAINGANLQHVSDTQFTITTPPGAGTVALSFKVGADTAPSAVTRFSYS